MHHFVGKNTKKSLFFKIKGANAPTPCLPLQMTSLDISERGGNMITTIVRQSVKQDDNNIYIISSSNLAMPLIFVFIFLLKMFNTGTNNPREKESCTSSQKNSLTVALNKFSILGCHFFYTSEVWDFKNEICDPKKLGLGFENLRDPTYFNPRVLGKAPSGTV